MEVTESALVARINRKLAPEHQKVCKCRESSSAFNDLGRFYVLDTYRNAIENSHIDIENFARELGVMRPEESIG